MGFTQGQDNAWAINEGLKILGTEYTKRSYTEDDAREVFEEFLKTQNDPFDKEMEPKDLGKLFEDWSYNTAWNKSGQINGGNHFKRDEVDVGNIYQDKLERVMSKKFL